MRCRGTRERGRQVRPMKVGIKSDPGRHSLHPRVRACRTKLSVNSCMLGVKKAKYLAFSVRGSRS